MTEDMDEQLNIARDNRPAITHGTVDPEILAKAEPSGIGEEEIDPLTRKLIDKTAAPFRRAPRVAQSRKKQISLR